MKIIGWELLIPISIFSINVLMWTGVLLVPEGVIIYRDFNFPYLGENFVKSYYPIWDDVSSQSNIENLPRAVVYLPFIIMAALGLEMTFILKILIITTFIFLTAAMYLFSSNLLQQLNLNKKGYKLISIGASFIFAYSPIILYFSQSISLIISLGALALLLYFIQTKFNSRYFPLYATLALFLSAAHPFNLIMNVLIAVSFMLIINLQKISVRIMLLKTGITSITFLLIFSWFILPYISNQISSVDLGRESVLSLSTFEAVSTNDPFKIAILERDQFRSVNTAPEDFLGILIHYACLAALIVIALVVNFYRKLANRTRYLLIFFSIGFLLFILLSLGYNGPFGELYYSFITSSSVGWIFRSPLKFQMYQLFFIIPLFVVSLSIINQRLLKKQNVNPAVVTIIIISIFLGSSAYGIYHANMFTFRPIELPSEYYEINEMLKRQDGLESRVLYYPVYREQPTEWSHGHLIASYEAKNSQVPTFELFRNYNHLNEVLYEYPFQNGLLSFAGFYDLISSIGIGHIVFHNDTKDNVDQENLLRLLESKDVKIIYQKNDWFLFEILSNQTNRPFILDSIALVDIIPYMYEISSPSLGVITLDDFNTNFESNDGLVKLTILNDILKSSFDNILTNWTKVNDQFVETYPILVSSGDKYLFRVSQLADIAPLPYFQVLGYSPSEDAWEIGLTDVIDFNRTTSYPEKDRSIEFVENSTDYWNIFRIPENITQIKFVAPLQSINNRNGDSVAAYKLENYSNNATLHYHKEDPTTSNLSFNTTSPALLVFPETYDRGWKAIIGNQSIDSIRVFGSVNGFPIMKGGEYNVSIKYEPQEWLDRGIMISIITILSYLIIVNLRRLIPKPIRQ